MAQADIDARQDAAIAANTAAIASNTAALNAEVTRALTAEGRLRKTSTFRGVVDAVPTATTGYADGDWQIVNNPALANANGHIYMWDGISTPHAWKDLGTVLDVASNVVCTTNTNQTITGEKTFSSPIKSTSNGLVVQFADPSENWSSTGTSTILKHAYSFRYTNGQNVVQGPYIEVAHGTSGRRMLSLCQTNDSGEHSFGLSLEQSPSGEKKIFASDATVKVLGHSFAITSLPNYGDLTAKSTSFSSGDTFTADRDGFVFVTASVVSASSNAFISILPDSSEGHVIGSTCFSPAMATPAGGAMKAFIPIENGHSYRIYFSNATIASHLIVGCYANN